MCLYVAKRSSPSFIAAGEDTDIFCGQALLAFELGLACQPLVLATRLMAKGKLKGANERSRLLEATDEFWNILEGYASTTLHVHATLAKSRET